MCRHGQATPGGVAGSMKKAVPSGVVGSGPDQLLPLMSDLCQYWPRHLTKQPRRGTGRAGHITRVAELAIGSATTPSPSRASRGAGAKLFPGAAGVKVAPTVFERDIRAGQRPIDRRLRRPHATAALLREHLPGLRALRPAPSPSCGTARTVSARQAGRCVLLWGFARALSWRP